MTAAEARHPEQALKRAEIAKLTAEARHLELEAAPLRRREDVLAKREVIFAGDVDEFQVAEAVETLRDLRAVSLDPITLVLNSPGGDVFTGYMLFDLVREYAEEGIIFTTRVLGYAASMAAVLSQSAQVRSISPNSWFMVHEPSTIIWGKSGDIKREAKLMEALHDQQCRIFAERSTLTFESIKKRSQDKDWWLPATEALEVGFFDELR